VTVVVAVWGGKGGLGKTTTAERLALLLGLLGYKVLFIDANIDQRSGEAVYQQYLKVGYNPPYDFALTEDFELIGKARTLGYHFVIVDCPPSKREADGALKQADFVLAPFTPKWMETKAITMALANTIQPLNKPYKVLFVGVGNHDKAEARTSREAFAGFDVPVYDVTVRLYKGHQKSQARGLPLFLDEASAYLTGRAPTAKKERSTAPFEFDPDDYSIEQWHEACLLHYHDEDMPGSHDECRIPLREPDGTVSQPALDAIADQVGGSFAAAADDYREFYREFIIDIRQHFGEKAGNG